MSFDTVIFLLSIESVEWTYNRLIRKKGGKESEKIFACLWFDMGICVVWSWFLSGATTYTPHPTDGGVSSTGKSCGVLEHMERLEDTCYEPRACSMFFISHNCAGFSYARDEVFGEDKEDSWGAPNSGSAAIHYLSLVLFSPFDGARGNFGCGYGADEFYRRHKKSKGGMRSSLSRPQLPISTLAPHTRGFLFAIP